MRSEGWDGREENGEPGLHSTIFLTARLVPRDEGRGSSVGLICPLLRLGLILRRPRVVRLPAPMGMGTTAQPPQQGWAKTSEKPALEALEESRSSSVWELTMSGRISGCYSFSGVGRHWPGPGIRRDTPCPRLHFHPHSGICPDPRALSAALVGLVFFMGLELASRRGFLAAIRAYGEEGTQ